jgi:hypothetical protein
VADQNNDFRPAPLHNPWPCKLLQAEKAARLARAAETVKKLVF